MERQLGLDWKLAIEHQLGLAVRTNYETANWLGLAVRTNDKNHQLGLVMEHKLGLAARTTCNNGTLIGCEPQNEELVTPIGACNM